MWKLWEMGIVCVWGELEDRVCLVLFGSTSECGMHSMQRPVLDCCIESGCRVCAQGRSSSRKKAEAAANEDQDKPYVCDSKEKQKQRTTRWNSPVSH